jgi:DNA invertase Pin-like site-specific DNA recombinase
MTLCAIYLRTSAEESRGEFSMVNDLDMCRAHAAAQGYTIVGEFNDVRPDGDVDRPGLNTLRQALAQHGGAVMVIPRDEALAPNPADRDTVVATLEREGISVEVARPLAARVAAA